MSILRPLLVAGLTLRADANGGIVVKPANLLTDELRHLIRVHRAEVLAELGAAHRLAVELEAAAMAACDCYGDSVRAREQMKRECMETPICHRADLLSHFQQTYGDRK